MSGYSFQVLGRRRGLWGFHFYPCLPNLQAGLTGRQASCCTFEIGALIFGGLDAIR